MPGQGHKRTRCVASSHLSTLESVLALSGPPVNSGGCLQSLPFHPSPGGFHCDAEGRGCQPPAGSRSRRGRASRLSRQQEKPPQARVTAFGSHSPASGGGSDAARCGRARTSQAPAIWAGTPESLPITGKVLLIPAPARLLAFLGPSSPRPGWAPSAVALLWPR